MITRLRYPKGYQFFDSNGAPLALGCLYYYIAGSTTPQDTYSDSAGAIPNTNPIVLDGSGRLQADVYLGSAADYKEVLLASGVTVAPWPDDNIERATPIAVFTGDSGSGGNAGLVPAPVAGDALANKFLKADGTWATTPAGGSGATNLSVTETATTVSIASSSGSGATIPAATSSQAGVLDSARASRIDGLATVATSGSYADLSNKPTIPAASSSTPTMDGTAAAGSSSNYARADHVHPTDTSRAANAPFTGDSGSGGTAGLVPAPGAGRAAAGAYLKADGTWTVPPDGGGGGTPGGSSGQIQWNSGGSFAGFTASGDATINTATGAVTVTKINGSTPATVAISGSYNDLSNKPTIPAAQVNSDWNAGSGVAQILNKPTLAAVATSGSYSDLSNKPTSMTPSAHAATHANGGGDAISIAASQVSGIPASLASQNLDNVARVGIGTTDAANKLSVAGSSVLFANSSGDIRATLSKNAVGSTASFVFQDNFSGRAEFGLCGNDSFTMKVSPDGTAWNNGIVISTAGVVTFPSTGGFTGDSGSGGAAGLVPAPGAGTAAAGKYLKADGTWAVPPGGSASPGGSSGQLQYNNAGAFGGVPAVNGDGTLNTSTGALAVTKIGGQSVSLAGSFTISGAYSTAFTVTAATSLTLPTGGTVLSTTSGGNLTAGYTATSYSLGTLSSGTTTLSAANGNVQHATNGGAFTLAPQGSPSTIALEIVNNASAGAITTSGYTKVVGSFVTTNAAKFQCISCVTNSTSALYITQVV